MSKFLKLLGIIFVLSLLALSFTGCMDGASTIILKVDTPSNDTSVTTPTITVSGHVAGTEKSNAKVTINDASVPIKDDKFSADVNLTEGKNVITVGATNGSVNLKEQVTVTYTPAK